MQCNFLSPTAVALHAHGMIAKWQNDFDANLHTDPTLLASLEALSPVMFSIFLVLRGTKFPLFPLFDFADTSVELDERRKYNT